MARFKDGARLLEPKSRRASFFIAGHDEQGFPLFIHDTYDDPQVPTIFLPIGPEMPEIQTKWPGEENLAEERVAVLTIVKLCRQYRQVLEGQMAELGAMAEQIENLMEALVAEKRKSDGLAEQVAQYEYNLREEGRARED